MTVMSLKIIKDKIKIPPIFSCWWPIWAMNTTQPLHFSYRHPLSSFTNGLDRWIEQAQITGDIEIDISGIEIERLQICIFGCMCGSQMVIENRLEDLTILCKKKVGWLDWERKAGAKYKLLKKVEGG